MNYDLAKKLKDAGFPQRTEIFMSIGGIPMGSNVDDGTLEGLSIPTLSELIEACGDEFSSLNKQGQGATEDEKKLAVKILGEEVNWLACSYKIMMTGKTPEEAVANLWLALNKK